ncbi:hypothetical protein AAG906_038308 [Vitis piasezkii]
MNMGSEDVNEDLFGLEDEYFGEEINSRMNVTNISSRGSNRGGSDGRIFQPMIEAIGQYGVGMKGPTFHEVSGPLVRVLRLVDGGKKAPMGYIYKAMNRAKDTLVRSFNGNEEKYKEIFNIIDKMWEIQLHRPLHAVELTRDPAKQEKVVAELNGGLHMELQLQICKAYEFLQIHSKRRNRLDHQRLNDLRRYNERNIIDPISLNDIDDSNEWLIGRMEDEDSHGDAQDNFVFDDDNLTWGDVARVTRAEETRFDTRARVRASSSIIPPTRGIVSSSRTLPSHSLIDEDEDGDMVDSADEEDGEGYKCGDDDDDDDDFFFI